MLPLAVVCSCVEPLDSSPCLSMPMAHLCPDSWPTCRSQAIQTSQNTVDVRGRQADDAAAEVQSAVLSAPPGFTLFVVHGVGTGRVRAEVLRMLKRIPRVAKLEEAEASNGGCTVVYIK